MKRFLPALISVLILSGCASSSQVNSEFSPADIAFAEMMIPHHEQAIEMSEIALLNTANPEVLQLAQEIKDAQSPEIEIMKSWTGVNVSTHAGHMIDGMLSESELSDLRNAKGKPQPPHLHEPDTANLLSVHGDIITFFSSPCQRAVQSNQPNGTRHRYRKHRHPCEG